MKHLLRVFLLLSEIFNLFRIRTYLSKNILTIFLISAVNLILTGEATAQSCNCIADPFDQPCNCPSNLQITNNNWTNVSSGQVWCVTAPSGTAITGGLNGGTLIFCTAGSYTLNVSNIGAGSKIYINSGVTVNISSPNSTGGAIYNRGTLNISGNMAINNVNGAEIMNSGTLNVSGDLGSIYGKFTNYGTVTVGGKFGSFQSGTSNICLANGSSVTTKDFGDFYGTNNQICVPQGSSGCVKFTGRVNVFNTTVTNSSELTICQATGASAQANPKWGSATVLQNCSDCPAPCVKPPKPATTNITLCAGDAPLDITTGVSYDNAGNTLVWYSSSQAEPVSAPAINTANGGTATYYVSQRNQSDATCESDMAQITVTIDPDCGISPEILNRTAHYVKVNGSGNKDGSSWENAMDNEIFAKYLPLVPDGVTFHIAEGTYHPIYDAYGEVPVFTIDKTFFIKSNVTLTGGYPDNAKTGNAPYDPQNYKTIFEGNINGEEVNSMILAFSNSLKIRLNGLYIQNTESSAIACYSADSELYLKDVTVSNGLYYAILAPYSLIVNVENSSFYENNGVIGVYNYNGKVMLNNVKIKENSGNELISCNVESLKMNHVEAKNNTGQLICVSGGKDVTITNSEFENNRHYSGIIFSYVSDNFIITDSKIINNVSDNGVAGIENCNSNSELTIERTVFDGNKGYISHLQSNSIKVKIDNSIFRNGESESSALLFANWANESFYSFSNSTIDKNISGNILFNGGGNMSFTNNTVTRNKSENLLFSGGTGFNISFINNTIVGNIGNNSQENLGNIIEVSSNKLIGNIILGNGLDYLAHRKRNIFFPVYGSTPIIKYNILPIFNTKPLTEACTLLEPIGDNTNIFVEHEYFDLQGLKDQYNHCLHDYGYGPSISISADELDARVSLGEKPYLDILEGTYDEPTGLFNPIVKDNGGFTPTVALTGTQLPDGRKINSLPLTVSNVTADQRNVQRNELACIGAYEYDKEAPVEDEKFLLEYYVKVNGEGTGDGSSWENAMSNESFAKILPKVPDGVTFHVAAGIYYPVFRANAPFFPWEDYEYLNSIYDYITEDKYKAFEIKSKVKIIGGYPFDAATGATTDPDLHKTIFSGDLNNNDVWEYDIFYKQNKDWWDLVNDTMDDNIYAILLVYNSGKKAELYGVTFKGSRYEGAIVLYDSDLLIDRCSFIDNVALYDGGAASALSIAGNCSVDITNAIFKHNVGSFVGGVIITQYADYEGDVALNISNSVFEDNNMGAYGSGITIISPFDRKHQVSIEKSTFYQNGGNHPYLVGGAIYAGNASLSLINNSFIQNYTGGAAGAIFCYDTDLALTNNTFIGNESPLWSLIYGTGENLSTMTGNIFAVENSGLNSTCLNGGNAEYINSSYNIFTSLSANNCGSPDLSLIGETDILTDMASLSSVLDGEYDLTTGDFSPNLEKHGGFTPMVALTGTLLPDGKRVNSLPLTVSNVHADQRDVQRNGLACIGAYEYIGGTSEGNMNIHFEGSKFICAGVTATLTAQVADGNGNYTYAWTGGGISKTGQTVNVTPGITAEYTLTVTDIATQKTVTDNVTVTVINPKIEISGQDGSVIKLTAPSGFTYKWNTGAAAQSIDVAPVSEAKYWVTISNDFVSCSDTVEIKPNMPCKKPVIDLPSTAGICTDGQTVVLEAKAEGKFLWSPSNETTPSISVSEPGFYKVKVTNKCGSTEKEVHVESPSHAGVDAFIASGDPCAGRAELKATGGKSYKWYPSDYLSNPDIANPVATPPGTRTYSVAIRTNGGCTVIKNVPVEVKPKFNLEVADVTGCLKDTVTLEAYGADEYTWYPMEGLSCVGDNCSSTQYTIIADKRTFTVTGTKNGCSKQAAITVSTNITNSVSLKLDDITENCGVSLFATPGFSRYTWDFGDKSALQTTTENTVSHKYNMYGSYRVCVIFENSACPKDVKEACKVITINPEDCKCDPCNNKQ